MRTEFLGFGDRVGVYVGEIERRAQRSEFDGGGSTDAAPGAGDDDGFV